MSKHILVSVASLGLLLACNGDPDTKTKDKLLDTGWFDDTDGSNGACDDLVAFTEPSVDQSNWYWRDFPTVWTDTQKAKGYEARLASANGVLVETETVWSEVGNSFQLQFEGGLEPNTDYVLSVRDCNGWQDTAFTTSELGMPLDFDPNELIGNTYDADLVGATWLEPGGMGGLLSLYFNTPVLLGVQYADGDLLDILGAPGRVDSSGDLKQDFDQVSWDFPVASFTDQPFLSAQTSAVVFEFDGVDVPIYDFLYTATFTPDGEELANGAVQGIGDTRFMGELLAEPGAESAVCDLAVTLGVDCIPCPNDNKPYCLFMKAKDVDGTLVPGLKLKDK